MLFAVLGVLVVQQRIIYILRGAGVYKKLWLLHQCFAIGASGVGGCHVVLSVV